jgi:FMN phosphatase YigB (HAD superfamily)
MLGDDYEADMAGARSAGLASVHLDRRGAPARAGSIPTLGELDFLR